MFEGDVVMAGQQCRDGDCSDGDGTKGDVERDVDAVDESRVGAVGHGAAEVGGDGERVAGLGCQLLRQRADDEVGAVDGGQHAAQDGDAECPADLACQVVHGRRHALLGFRQSGSDGAGGRSHRRAHAGAQDEQPGSEDPVIGVLADLGDDGERDRDQRQTGDTDVASAEAVGQLGGQARGRHHRRRHRQHAHRRDESRVVSHDLQVLEDEEDEAVEPEELHEDGHGAGGQASPPEDARIQHRGAPAEFDGHEGGEHRQPEADAEQGAGR